LFATKLHSIPPEEPVAQTTKTSIMGIVVMAVVVAYYLRVVALMEEMAAMAMQLMDFAAKMGQMVVWHYSAELLMESPALIMTMEETAVGPGSVANGENGHEGGLAIGTGSNANGGGMAIEGGNTEGGGGFADDGATHPGCDIDIDHECFNQPGR
jgi:hypothetical protein